VLVAAVAVLLIGPYSYLAGAISLDFGGKRGGATASGIIDGVGYLFGGVVAGKVVSSLSQTMGWQGVFRMLAGVALLTGLVAACFLVNQLRPAAPASGIPLGVGGRGIGAVLHAEENEPRHDDRQ
jgi:OPA family glycerol-3-phosphate transporter-like MFS transporter